MRIVGKLLVGVTPLLLTFLFAWLVMEDYLSFGGGEKEIFLAVPPLIWSFLFLVCYLVLWWRRLAPGRSVVVSSAIATGLVALAWVVLYGVMWFRFG